MNSVLQFSIVLIFLIVGVKKRRVSLEVATLVSIFLGVLAGCSWVTITGYYQTSGGGIPPMQLDSNQAEIVSLLFFKAIMCLLVGSLFSNLKLFNTASQKSASNISDIKTEFQFSKALFFLLNSILLIFVTMNFGEIISRDSYLFIAAGSLSGAIRYLIPLIGIISAWMTFKSNNKLLHFGNYFTCILIEFSAASRSLGILLMIFFLFWASNTVSKFHFFARVSIGIYLGGVGVSQALYLRSQGLHGLLPHFEQLALNSFSSNAFGNVFGTFLVIIPVTLLGLQVPTPSNYLLTSINPLPGRLTDWYKIADKMLLNPWTPTGSIAQIHNLGVAQEFTFWIILGFVLGLLGKYSSTRDSSLIVSLISTALILSASLQFLQYSVRAGMRFVYADMLFLFLVNFYSRKKFTKL